MNAVPEARMGKRAAQKLATRERLAAVAREAFRRDGFQSVTFRRLAEEAQCSTGAYFASWADKNALWLAVMGTPAPDVVTFLERVAVECAGDQLSLDALELRKQLIGAG